MKFARPFSSLVFLLLFIGNASAAFADPVKSSVRAAGGDQVANLTRLLLAGPYFVLILAACFSLILLVAVLFETDKRLLSMLDDAAERISARRFPLTIWGIASFVLLVALALLMSKIHGILAVVVAIFGLIVIALGLAAACFRAGSRLTETDVPLARFSTGLWLTLGASAVPFAGWIFAAIAISAGIGGVLESLISRRKSGE